MRLCTRQLLLAWFPAAAFCGFVSLRTPDPVQGPAAPEPLAIGVVDLDRVSLASRLVVDGRKEREAKFAAMQQALNQMQVEYANLEGKLEGLQEASWERRHIQIDLRAKADELEAKRQLFHEQLDEELGQLQHTVFDRIQEQIDLVARKRKLSLVLRWRELPEAGRAQSMRERLQVYSMRDLLWRAPTLDITDDVILAMNR